MTGFTAVLADDEEILRQGLAAQLNRLWPELEIRGMAENGIQALEMIETCRPDIAFLDIRMPGMTGMDVAKKLPAGVIVVFITAYDQFAVDAFESEAVDYVLKPVREQRLMKTIGRLKDRLAGPEADAGMAERVRKIIRAMEQRAPREYLRLVRVRTGSELRLVPVSEVLYFKAEDKYTIVRTREKEFLIKTPVKDLETGLDPDRFWRVHRNAIVNIDAISAVKRSFTNQLIVTFTAVGDTIRVSRSYAHLFSHM